LKVEKKKKKVPRVSQSTESKMSDCFRNDALTSSHQSAGYFFSAFQMLIWESEHVKIAQSRRNIRFWMV